MLRWFFCNHFLAATLAAFCIVLAGTVYAQNTAGQQPVPLPAPVPAPVDQPYAGTIALSVDLTNVNDRVLNVREAVPVKPGELTLLYPEWLPGTHSPSNPVVNLAGLIITANGKRISWLRDPVNMYSFHIDAPQGATSLDIDFQFVAPLD